MRAILVSVDYTDLLRLTLPYNRHHFESVLVVTSKADEPNLIQLCKDNRTDLYATDAFYEGGARFNKWKALEQGLDVMGRHGWLCIMDADVLWPKGLQIKARQDMLLIETPALGADVLVPGKLCSPLRHMLIDIPATIPPEREWLRYPTHKNVAEWAGYTQIFHASDPVLGQPPWHETDWRHAGGADSFFQYKWQPHDKIRPRFNVLHLGPAGVNWCGRASAYVDGRIPDGSEEKKEQIRKFVGGRTKGEDRFKGEKL